MNNLGSYIALDVGAKRIGVAFAGGGVKIAVPLQTVLVDGSEIDKIKAIYTERQAVAVVVGFPRNQSGEATAQTAKVEAFADRLKAQGLEVIFQDESLTSVEAELALAVGKKEFSKGDIDAQAAALILQDFIDFRG